MTAAACSGGTIRPDHRSRTVMSRHREVPVKVNAFVDEGIAELVAALSEVPGLVTMESCQGGDGQDAYVFFRMSDWRRMGEFMFEQLLPIMSPDLRSMTALRVQAYDTNLARGSLTLDPHAVPLMADCLRTLTAPVRSRPLMAGDAHGETIAQGVIAA